MNNRKDFNTNSPNSRMEFFVNEYETSNGFAVSAYFDISGLYGETSISCGCGDPYACKCEIFDYPCPKPLAMKRSAFKEPTPFLMFNIKRLEHDPIGFIFMSKSLAEVKTEVNRLNSKLNSSMMEWYYEDEWQYNAAVIAEHEQYMHEMG